MNENVGQERREKEERAEGWLWWWVGGVVVCVVLCVWCGVVCCGVVVCVCMLRNKFLSRVCTQPRSCVVIRKGTAKSGACDVIRLNTGKLTKFRHSKYWQIDSSLLIQWIVVRGRSSLMESLVWLIPILCVQRKRGEKEERRKKKEERRKKKEERRKKKEKKKKEERRRKKKEERRKKKEERRKKKEERRKKKKKEERKT